MTLQVGNTSVMVLTDGSGSFTIGGVPPGRYYLSAERNGYLSADGLGRPTANAFASVTAQERPAPVVLRLTPAAAIAGTVTDEAGLALPTASVTLIRRTVWNGQGRLSTANQTNANDLGEFRLSRVPAGRYLVCVNATASSYQRHHALAYPSVYYPGVTDPASAQWVNLTPGEELHLTFRMTPVRGIRVSGSVVSAGKTTSVSVRRTDAPGFPQTFSPSVNWDEKTSSFDILALTPGDYLITANSNLGDGRFLRAMRTIQAGTDDIRNIRLTLRDGPYLTGTVRMGDTPISVDSRLNIAITGDYRLTVHAPSSGSFQWPIVEPGEYSMTVLPAYGWHLQAITQGGADITGGKIAIGDDSDPVPIEIVLAQGGGSIEVTPQDASGKPAAQGKLTLLRRSAAGTDWEEEGQPTYWGGPGTLTLGSIPPGEYLLFAWPSVSEVEYLSPEVIQEYQSFGQAVSVRDGETTRVTVTPVRIE